LITGIAVTGDAAPPPRTGPSPMPAPASAGGGGLYEDTSRTYPGPVLPAPGLSASVTSQLSLHLFNQPPPRSPAAGRAIFAKRRPTPANRRAVPVVPLGAAALHLSAGKVLLCRWWR